MTTTSGISLKQVKAAARAVVAMSAGLHAGACRLRGSIRLLPEAADLAIPAIDAFLADVRPDMPTGESRLYVSEEALVQADEELRMIEPRHRTAVLLECKRIYFACSRRQREAPSAI